MIKSVAVAIIIAFVVVLAKSNDYRHGSEFDIRQTTNGPVKGRISKKEGRHVLSFFQIPFAEPPLGDLRFRKPLPLKANWTDARDCTKRFDFNECPQVKTLGVVIGSEDCLTLDVYVPLNVTTKGPLPVLFWLYGGGFTLGDDYEVGWYDARKFSHEKEVIIVAANYRLNVFGFLALEEFATPTGGVGNYGLQDQRLALKWTKENIANFGGDPNSVTLFGQSSGGESICAHMISPASAGLFHGAIMESASCDAEEEFQDRSNLVGYSNDYAKAVGCDSPNDLATCLRKLSTKELMKPFVKTILNPNFPNTDKKPDYQPALSPLFMFTANVDGDVEGLLDIPLKLLESGKFYKVPTIIGTNEKEGNMFVPLFNLIVKEISFPLDEEKTIMILQHFFNDTASELVFNKYNDGIRSYSAIVADAYTDYSFACASRRAAKALAKWGVPTYLYQFVYAASFIEERIFKGNFHTSELDFVWNTPWPAFWDRFDGDDKIMSKTFQFYWKNMAKCGNPNCGDFTYAEWPKYSLDKEENIFMDVPARVGQHLKKDVCDFWDTIRIKEKYQVHTDNTRIQ